MEIDHNEAFFITNCQIKRGYRWKPHWYDPLSRGVIK